MTIADEARDNAIHFEGIKYSYRQTRDGTVVSFVVQPHDIPAELSSSHIGSRYMIALVEIGDDERPKPKQSDWRKVTPTAQAAIRCDDPNFRKFLKQKHDRDTANKDDAARAIREMCGVASRIEFSTNHKARTLWFNIDTQYREWAHL